MWDDSLYEGQPCLPGPAVSAACTLGLLLSLTGAADHSVSEPALLHVLLDTGYEAAKADLCSLKLRSIALQDYKLKLTTLERRRLDYDADRRSIAKLEMKRQKASEKNVALKPEVTTQLQAKEHTALGKQLSPSLLVLHLPEQVSWSSLWAQGRLETDQALHTLPCTMQVHTAVCTAAQRLCTDFT